MYSAAVEINRTHHPRSPVDSSPLSYSSYAHHDVAERGRSRYRHFDPTEQRQEDDYYDSHQPSTTSMVTQRYNKQYEQPPNKTNIPAAPPSAVQPKMPPILPPPGSVPESSGGGSGFVSGIEAAAASALTLANSIAFRPTTTQPAKCSKLKIRIFFDSTIFQAGGNLFGRMEITATSSRSLKLGEIAVELAAYEEITSKDFTATQSFLSSRLCFQGPNIPPSNAVHGPCDEDGFWMAKKGKTTFPFAFQLPLDCPSSLVFGQTASLRYVVTGLVQVFYHGKDETIMKTKEAFVVEAWDGYNPDYKLPVQASNSTKLFWGGSGSLVLEAKLSEKLHSAGGNLNVEVKVKNNTSRKVQGIRLGVARRLEMVSNKAKAQQNPGLQIDTVSVSEVMGTQEFKSSSYLFDTGEERTTTLNMIVPGNARTIRGTALFEVTCFVVVSMLLGAFSGELSVEIPVKICHPASLTPAPKPKLDENHLPHHYNLVDEELDLDNNKPTRSSRRVGSNDSLASPTAGGRHAGSGTGRELPWTSDGTEKQDGYADSGRMGEWSQDARELSPANSITSIKSILSSPKQKLSKLADKIQRSTSPSSSSHLQHEHRQGSKHMDEQQGRRQLAKSPPLGPAMPIAYVPAVERVRYTPFQPPPTTKAKEFLKAAAQYQQEMAKNGALSRFEGDNVEFDLDDKKMASAIHQWITKKELDGMYGQMPEAQPIARSVSPIQIPAASPNRRRPDVDPINTQVGSFTSQYSPTGASPQSYDSPTAFGASSQFPPSPKAMPYTNQTTSRFLHHPHRQPAAPQTEAFGSAPEDCITDPPLFAKPLPLPSPPGAGSSLRAGATMATARARSLSPVPIPLQTPESLALAREAFERVKKIASPVQDHMVDTASLRKSAPQPEPVGPHTTSSVESNPNTRVPILVSVSSSRPNNPSGLSRLLSRSAESTDLPKDLQEGEATKDTPSTQPKSSAELRHIPMSRPLPIPVLNSQQPNIKAGSSSRNFEPRLSLESKMQSATSTSYGQSKHLQQPRGLSKSPPRFEPPTRSGHLPLKEHRKQDSISFVRQNAYVPKPTPVPKAKPPAPIQHSITSTQTGSTTGINAHNVKKINERSMIPGATQSSNSGFVYPKAARKPVSGTKPSVAAKPKALSIPSNHLNQETGKSLSHVPISVATAMMSPEDHANVDQHHPQNHPNEARATDDGVHELERPLAPAPSVRAPQVIPVLESEIATAASPRDLTSAIEEADEDNKDTNQIDQLTSAESQQQMHNDIRAQAIAAKYSIRATGAHTGGYMVNTGKLRQVINDNNNNSNNNSGHLIHALAGGALNAATAAASGFGWLKLNSSNTSDGNSTSPIQPSLPAVDDRDGQPIDLESNSKKFSPLSHGSHQLVEQQHDLTMRDIHFQTIYSMDVQQPPMLDLPAVPISSIIVSTTPNLAETNHNEYGRSKSHHLVKTASPVILTTQQAQSRSQPGSRFLDESTRAEPLPAISVPLAVEAIAIEPISASAPAASVAAPNFDKTLPKIHESTSRSRMIERPVDYKNKKAIPPLKASSSTSSDQSNGFINISPSTQGPVSPISNKPLPRLGNDPSAGETSINRGFETGPAGVRGAPKAINPKLQAYIQKYNLAASARP